MAASAGSLVVSLGLDAAEYTKGLTKAQYQARQFGEAIGNGIRTAALGAATALTAMSASAVAAAAGFDALVKAAGDFQDLAEKTGGSAEGLASLAVSAAVGGQSMEAVAAASIKLTKNLTGVDDESKAAGAAIAALGLNLADFKSLKPEDQIEAVAKALNGFEDGAGKTAVAVALLGKSGADMLPFLKELGNEGGRQVILTQEQIALADEYADKQAKARAQLSLHAQAIATAFIPALTSLTNVATDLIKEFVGIEEGASKLANQNAIQEFANRAIDLLGRVADAGQIVARGFDIVGSAIGILAATAAQAAKGNIGHAIQIQLDGAKDLYNKVATIGDNLISDRIKKGQAAAKKAADDAASMGFYNRPQPRPELKFGGAVKTGGGGAGKDTAAQEAKARLASDLDAIKNAQEAITNTYANQGKVLDALRSAGLKEEGAYYQEKQRLIAQTAAAQEDALQKQIARLQQEQLAGKDAIDNARKIADAESKLQKVREDSATAAQVLSIEQEAAMKRVQAAFLSAQQAAQDFFDTTNRGYAREIAGIGKGSKARSFDAGITQIEDKYRQQRQDLQNRRSQQELAGSFGPEAQKQFNDQLALINDFQTKAIDSYKNYYDTINEAQSNWLNGATEALHNYADEAANVAKHTEETFSNAFKGLEDQFTNLLTGKKFDVKKLLDDISGDIARNFVKENVTGPLAKLGGDLLGDGGALSALFGGSSEKSKDAFSGRGTIANPIYVRAADVDGLLGKGGISGLFGGGGSTDELGDFLKSSGIVGGSSSSGGWLDMLAGLFGKAGGGLVGPNSMHRVNENGPELLDVNGKQYLLNGNQNARVTPNHKTSSGGFLQTNNFVVQGKMDHRSQDQMTNELRRKTNTAAARLK